MYQRIQTNSGTYADLAPEYLVPYAISGFFAPQQEGPSQCGCDLRICQITLASTTGLLFDERPC